MRRLLVSGAGGLIGSHLVAALEGINQEPVRVTRGRDKHQGALGGHFCGALTDPSAWVSCFRESKELSPTIYHLAAQTSAKVAEANPESDYRSNVEVISAIISAIRDYRKTKPRFKPIVIFSSTATVYGPSPSLPVQEEAPLVLTTTYDLHKYQAEELLRGSEREGLLDLAVLRLPNVYGSMTPRSVNDRGVLERWIAAAIRGENLPCFGGGDYLRDYLHVGDLVNLLLVVGQPQTFRSGVFNPGSGTGQTVREIQSQVVTLANEMCGAKAQVVDVDPPSDLLEIDKRDYVANISRSRITFGWDPETNFTDGLMRLVQTEASVFAQKGGKSVE